MMNPPLIIPLEETGDKGEVEIKLSYRMGGGLDSVEASII
jgi:predicted RNA methylase